MSQSATQPAATPHTPGAGCAYLVAAVATGTAAVMAWIYDAVFHAPVNHGVLLAAAIIATIAGCGHIVRVADARMQYRIDDAREEGYASGYVAGVSARASDPHRLRSVT